MRKHVGSEHTHPQRPRHCPASGHLTVTASAASPHLQPTREAWGSSFSCLHCPLSRLQPSLPATTGAPLLLPLFPPQSVLNTIQIQVRSPLCEPHPWPLSPRAPSKACTPPASLFLSSFRLHSSLPGLPVSDTPTTTPTPPPLRGLTHSPHFLQILAKHGFLGAAFPNHLLQNSPPGLPYP